MRTLLIALAALFLFACGRGPVDPEFAGEERDIRWDQTCSTIQKRMDFQVPGTPIDFPFAGTRKIDVSAWYPRDPDEVYVEDARELPRWVDYVSVQKDKHVFVSYRKGEWRFDPNFDLRPHISFDEETGKWHTEARITAKGIRPHGKKETFSFWVVFQACEDL